MSLKIMVAKPVALLRIMDFDDTFLIQHTIYNCFSYHVFGNRNEVVPTFTKSTSNKPTSQFHWHNRS